MSSCLVPTCGRTVIAIGLCDSHYRRHRRGVPLDKPLRQRRPGATCSVDGCDRKHAADGYCQAHWRRNRNGLDVSAPITSKLVTDDLLLRLRTYAPAGAPDECWEWTRSRNKNYGAIAVHGSRMRQAHVVAWELHHGRELPAGMVVRHACDNPPCTNPAHLELGTHADNVDDKVSRGRQSIGESHGIAKLTESDVAEIRRLYAAGGLRQKDIAEMFGVTQSNISHITRRKQWTHT